MPEQKNGVEIAMNFKILPKAALSEWIEQLGVKYRIIGPKSLHSQYVFDNIHSAGELALDYPTTILPPKKALLPQRETILRFHADESRLEPLKEDQPTIILGVHTCDMHGIALLDRVFSEGFPDQHYLDRRKNTFLISIECLTPCSEHSFCKSMGTLTVPEGFDLHLTDLGDDYALDIGSERGEMLIQGLGAVHEGTDEDYQRVSRVMSEKWQRFPYRLDFDISELPSLLSVSYRSTLWDELGERCLACGMCTIVCPTCYCFNVIDEVGFSLDTGERFRVWDSCQLDKFATVAGGHDFRANRTSRQRHRFFRKGKYQTDAYNLVGCVGCGRCALACLVHISPVETFNTLYQRRITFSRRRQEVAS